MNEEWRGRHIGEWMKEDDDDWKEPSLGNPLFVSFKAASFCGGL
jgi:hypothetical protein